MYDRKGVRSKEKGESRNEKGIKFVDLDAVVKTDLLFLLVPISEIENVCRRIRQRLPKHTVVVDACSVKVWPVKIMKKYLPIKQPMIATHPLFGPDSVSCFGLEGQKIVVCPLRMNTQQERMFVALLEKMKLKIIRATPRKHDQELARSQALVHFIGRGLEKLSLKEQLISTPDYQALLRMNEMVRHDTWRLFIDMETLNPFAARVRRRLLAALRSVAGRLDKGGTDLASGRREIEKIDTEIVALAGRRLSIVKKLGKIKRAMGWLVLDRKRETELKRKHFLAGRRFGVKRKLVKKIFNLLLKEAKAIQG